MDVALIGFGLGVGILVGMTSIGGGSLMTLLIGSVPGVWLGSHWSVRVQPAVLRTTLAVVLIGAGTALLIKAGLGIPTWVLIPFPVGVIILLIVTMVRESRARAAAAAEAVRSRAQPPPKPVKELTP